MSRRKRSSKNQDSELENRSRVREREQEDTYRPRRGKRRRWPWILLALLLLLGLAPNLVGWLGLQQRVVDYALSDFRGKVTIEKLSLGWFQPIRISGISAVDADGNPLLQVDGINSSKPLYSLINASDYGQFNIERPVAYLTLRPNGSNLEDAIAAYLPTGVSAQPVAMADPAATTAIPKLAVNVVDGQAFIETTTTPETWQLSQLNAFAETMSTSAPLIINAQGSVTPVLIDVNGQPVGQPVGGLTLVAHVDTGSQMLNFNSADVALEMKELPLSLAAPVAQRFVGPAQTAGRVSGKLQANYDGNSQSVAANLDGVNLTDFKILAPELLGSDQFQIASVAARGAMQLSAQTIAAQQFSVESEVGKLQADGSFDVNQLTNLATNGELLDTPFRMDGQVDLAQLIRMLPATLRLHEDLVVNSGTVAFQAGSRNENGRRRMTLNVDAANLSATRGGQNVNWPKPLRVTGTIQELQGALAIEDLLCESDFLTIRGKADLSTGSFSAQGDLAVLRQRLSQFIDLSGTDFGGLLEGSFGWKLSPSPNAVASSLTVDNRPIQIGGSFVVTQPIIEMAGMPRWSPPELSVKLSATGQSVAPPATSVSTPGTQTKLQLDQGGLQVDIGSQRMVAMLAQPVADAFTNEIWLANCQMTGEMSGWLGHLQNFVDLGDIKSSGNLDTTCVAKFDGKLVQLENVQYAIEQFAFDGYGMTIREQKASGAATAIYDLNNGHIALSEATLNGAAMVAEGRNIVVRVADNIQIDGTIRFSADVNRLADWIELSPTKDSVFWFGRGDGTLQLASDVNGIGGQLDMTITDMVAAQQVAAPVSNQGGIIQASAAQQGWTQLWAEPRVGVKGQVVLANDFNAIALRDCSIDSPSLRARATGTISDMASSMQTDLTGFWAPSWEKINGLLTAYTGDLLKFAGQGEQPFRFRGPLFAAPTSGVASQAWVPPAFQAATEFGWQRGEILGLPVGASKLQVNLDQSIAHVTTAGIPFSGGVVKFAPRVDLQGPEPMLLMDWTRLIDNVELQPATARQWLKYVAPLVADATSAEGNFTVDVGAAEVPLLDPMKMHIKGAVKLNRVVIGAGPTAEQLLGTIKQLRTLLKPDASDRDYRTWLQMQDQTIPIEVVNGRVYHNDLNISHNDLTIRTKGSVGFDQTLEMVAEIPIAPDWIEGKPYLASLAGQSIRIPIRGTVSKPILDKRALEDLSKNLVKDAAGQALNKAIGDKVAPKLNEFQQEINGKIGNELNKFQEKLGGKLGGGLLQGLPGLNTNNAAPGVQPGQGVLPGVQPGTGGAAPGVQPAIPPGQSIEEQTKEKLQNEVFKGLNKLFGK